MQMTIATVKIRHITVPTSLKKQFTASSNKPDLRRKSLLSMIDQQMMVV